jgi:hypothetical protein
VRAPESIATIVSMDSGLALRAPRNDTEFVERLFQTWRFVLAAPFASERAASVRRPRNREGAGKAGSSPPPWPPCVRKCTGQEPQDRLGHPGLPCAMALRLIRALLGDRLFCPRHARCSSTASRAWPQHREARTTRLHRPCRRRSSGAAFTSIAARLHVRDDAYAPSMRRDGDREAQFPKKRNRYIFRRRSGQAESR